MADKWKKPKKRYFSDENLSSLLQRYTVKTALSLLQEVSQVAGDKIDWHEMVKNTVTGIFDAREYQIVWRHLAYGETLDDQIGRDQNPMDDDSDLEYELEVCPFVVRRASLEAAACVRVLISSGHAYDSHLSNSSTNYAPLSISIPNNNQLSAPSNGPRLANAWHRTIFTIPVSLQKVPSSSGLAGEKRSINNMTGVSLPLKKKRSCWSTEEDLKLTAAACKNVDPNWANIARVEFNDDRRANELSQRWATLKKKHSTLKLCSNLQQPHQLAAANRAMSMALDMPMSDNLKAASAGLKSQQPRKPSLPTSEQPLGRGGAPKPQAPVERLPTNPTLPHPDSMVRAAAGAHTADASYLLEAARSQKVVHITTGGGGSSSLRPFATSITSQLPSNVHFIRNGLVNAPISTYFAKHVVQPSPAAPTPVQKSVQDDVVSSIGNLSKEVIKHSQIAAQADSSGSTQMEGVPETWFKSM